MMSGPRRRRSRRHPAADQVVGARAAHPAVVAAAGHVLHVAANVVGLARLAVVRRSMIRTTTSPCVRSMAISVPTPPSNSSLPSPPSSVSSPARRPARHHRLRRPGVGAVGPVSTLRAESPTRRSPIPPPVLHRRGALSCSPLRAVIGLVVEERSPVRSRPIVAVPRRRRRRECPRPAAGQEVVAGAAAQRVVGRAATRSRCPARRSRPRCRAHVARPRGRAVIGDVPFRRRERLGTSQSSRPGRRRAAAQRVRGHVAAERVVAGAAGEVLHVRGRCCRCSPARRRRRAVDQHHRGGARDSQRCPRRRRRSAGRPSLPPSSVSLPASPFSVSELGPPNRRIVAASPLNRSFPMPP